MELCRLHWQCCALVRRGTHSGGAPGSILGLDWLQLERTELQEQVLRLGGGTALQQLKRLESRNAVLEAISQSP